VERSLAWLLANRRLTVRYERHADILTAFLHLGCADLCPQAPTVVKPPLTQQARQLLQDEPLMAGHVLRDELHSARTSSVLPRW
jgi:hypothetical protein